MKRKITNYIYNDTTIGILCIVLLFVCAFINWTWYWFGVAVAFYIDNLKLKSEIGEYRDFTKRFIAAVKELGIDVSIEKSKDDGSIK